MGNRSVKQKEVIKHDCSMCEGKESKYHIKSNIMCRIDHDACSNCLEIEKKWLASINMEHTLQILDEYE
jgi:hypothetical protein